jgi:hypothetical protein
MAKLTQTQVNILNAIKGSVDRAWARQAAILRRTTPNWKEMYRLDGDDYGSIIDAALGQISGATRAKDFSQLPTDARELLVDILSALYWDTTRQQIVQRDILRDLRENAAEYELMAQMPPVKKERKKREPKTLVGRRADAVDEKVREWERKLKLAKTKLNAYRKKQKYYEKKGAVA